LKHRFWSLQAAPVELTGRLQYLETLRGLAAVSVMVFHFFAQGVSPVHNQLAATLPVWMGAAIGQLFCGVDIFFVLSGFVIAFSMDGQAANLRYAGNFIVRRTVRLTPAYWAASALMLGYLLCMWPAKWHDFYLQFGGVKGLAANFFYVQNLSWIYPASSVLDISWTLCLEVQFYFSYLLILVAGYYAGNCLTGRAADVRRVVVLAAVATVAGWSFLHWLGQPTSNYAGRAWTFFLGVAVYHALTRGVPAPVVLLPLLVLLGLFGWRQELHSVIGIITAGSIFVAGVTGRLSTLLVNRPLVHLGRISYSIYLLHMVIGLNLLWLLPAHKAGSGIGAWLAVALASVFSLLGAELLHWLVEAPSNRLSQRLKRHRPAKTLVPQPAPS